VTHGTGAATGGRVGEQIAGHASPRLARVARPADIVAALDDVDVPRPRPVLVLVGGAGGMDEATQQVLARVLRDAVLPVVERHGAAVVDGGTDSGVMRMLGRARAERNGVFPLSASPLPGPSAYPAARRPTTRRSRSATTTTSCSSRVRHGATSRRG
jgi:hypothetical protein